MTTMMSMPWNFRSVEPRRTSRACTLAAAVIAAALAFWRSAPALAWGTDDQEIAGDLARMLELKSGSTVAEIGAGHGEMTVRMAQIVGPGGHVYSTEIDPKRIDEIRKRVADAGLANVTVIQASANETGLPPACCDAAYMIGVYHHITDPAATDAGIFRALKPGARLAIDDFPPTFWLALFKVKGVPANREGHGVADRIVVDEVSGAGFRLVEEQSPWHAGFLIRDNFCLLFQKPDSTAVR